ncbi:MAG: hypothetical protein QXL94_01460 [Candidatus Parvarchaeum sp.]|jgi:hypothetical protein
MHLSDDCPVEFSYNKCEKCEQIIKLIQKRTLEEKYTTKADLQEAFTGKRGNEGKRTSIETHIKELKGLGFIEIDNLIEIIGHKENGGIFKSSFYDTKEKGIQLNEHALYMQMIEVNPSLVWEWLERDDLPKFFWGIWKEDRYKCKNCPTKYNFKKTDDFCSCCGRMTGYTYTYVCLNCGFTYQWKYSFPV